MRSASRLTALIALLALSMIITLAPARTRAQARRGPFDALHFRGIGPAATGGRIHDLQIDPKNPAILYVGAATGGIWKSVNNGVTRTHAFGTQPANTFGARA